MNLGRCGTCEGLIPLEARECPRCGTPNPIPIRKSRMDSRPPAPRRRSTLLLIAAGIAGSAILVLLALECS